MKYDENQPPAKYVSTLSKIIDTTQHNLKNYGQLLPVAFLINNDTKKIEVFGATFGSENEKNYFAEIIKQNASKLQADAICFIAESWTTPEKYRNKESIEKILKEYGSISNFPERTEIILVNLETNEGVWTALADILPAKKGRKMGGLKWIKSDSIEGRFSHLLPIKYPTPKQVTEYLNKARKKFIASGINPEQLMETQSIIQMLDKLIRHAPVSKLTDDIIDDLISMLLKAKGDSNNGKN